MAIAPTATIANITGFRSRQPTYRNLYVKSNLSGEFTVVSGSWCDLCAQPGRGDDRHLKTRRLAREDRPHPAEIRALCLVRDRRSGSSMRGAPAEMDRPVQSSSTWRASGKREQTGCVAAGLNTYCARWGDAREKSTVTTEVS
jgi:hypothetical protein